MRVTNAKTEPIFPSDVSDLFPFDFDVLITKRASAGLRLTDILAAVEDFAPSRCCLASSKVTIATRFRFTIYGGANRWRFVLWSDGKANRVSIALLTECLHFLRNLT